MPLLCCLTRPRLKKLWLYQTPKTSTMRSWKAPGLTLPVRVWLAWGMNRHLCWGRRRAESRSTFLLTRWRRRKHQLRVLIRSESQARAQRQNQNDMLIPENPPLPRVMTSRFTYSQQLNQLSPRWNKMILKRLCKKSKRQSQLSLRSLQASRRMTNNKRKRRQTFYRPCNS